ncbi:MAG: ABC transporter permease subunit [Ruminococcaceae bacterium]|nr:ABC transporter permease subunit [Oscillospiraceae bacterium]
MAKLLQSNFARLWKSKSFWVCAVLTLALAVLNSVELVPDDTSWMYATGKMMVDGGSNSMIFAAIFAALYLGTDYACGTIRNKLAVGHSRANVYFASLITVTSGALLIGAVYTIPSVFKAIVWGKELGVPIGEFLLYIAILVCAMIALGAIFTLLGMLITEKSLTTTFTIILAIVLEIGSAVLLEFLNQPKEISGLEMTVDGITVTDPEPNPAYIGKGLKRNIMTAITDVLPGGQIMRLETGDFHNPEFYPLYSFGVIAVTTAAGMLIFRRKDLK